ncbi:MAG: roadblock/LC7 domain-containing protein [candidate division WOR-3 bacterium]|nr:MAG: roadblock/LC7 domain-containing protein [candidate division WOR-3 bacterium]UCF71371.1 MAG: roadblock/LC7 domain-containing protein [candidate division WOR-3 bacterium]
MKIKDLIKIPKVLGAGLVSDDGFIIDGQATYEYDTEKLGAIAARVVNRIKKSLDVEGASAIVYTRDNVLFLKEGAEGIIFVICQKDVNVGLVRIRLNKIA